MIELLNGRGQLGIAMQQRIAEYSFNTDVSILHAWEFVDKSEATQMAQFDKFRSCLAKAHGIPLFVSTLSRGSTPYVRWKVAAESETLATGGSIIRLPCIIGKGICANLKAGIVEPFGSIELVSLKHAVEEVLCTASKIGSPKVYSVSGEMVSAKIVDCLIAFGKNG